MKRRLFRGALGRARAILRDQITEILAYKPEGDRQAEPEPTPKKTNSRRRRTHNPVPSTIRPNVLDYIEARSDLSGELSLADARLHVVREIEIGCSCPACGQLSRVYMRKLNAGMAASLCWLVRTAGPGLSWVHVNKDAPKWVVRSRELAKLAHWGLLVDKKNKDTKKRTSGLWKPTLTGVDFAYDRIEIPKYVYLYDNTVMGISPETVVIQDALGDKFDYGDLMSRRW